MTLSASLRFIFCQKPIANSSFAAIAAAHPSAVAAANRSDGAAGRGGAGADTRRDGGSGWRRAAVFPPPFVAAFLTLNPKLGML